MPPDADPPSALLRAAQVPARSDAGVRQLVRRDRPDPLGFYIKGKTAGRPVLIVGRTPLALKVIERVVCNPSIRLTTQDVALVSVDVLDHLDDIGSFEQATGAETGFERMEFLQFLLVPAADIDSARKQFQSNYLRCLRILAKLR